MMDDKHTQQLGLELTVSSQPASSGFRLKYLEVFNWGTFHGQVWRVNLDGNNGLLTGDIGSGKSTIVDAVTTLLVPSNRVAYNKAAGAELKERNLRSYVLGYYKSERNETTGTSKPVGLRDDTSYSVILGTFYNAGYDQTVTLAQVFWIKDSQSAPARFYVAAEKALSIQGEFADFGSDMPKLRKRLKAQECEIFDTFPGYSAWFRRRFGIENEQALELFHQTVSLKSVGNLTDFVRSHMLKPVEEESRLDALIHHFDDLNSAHESVRKAARQIQLLTPLVADCQKQTTLQLRCDELKACREALKTYFGTLKSQLLETKIEQLALELSRTHIQIERANETLARHRAEESDLKQSIAENGGARIERLTHEIQSQETILKTRRQKAQRYAELLAILDLASATNSHDFFDQLQSFKQKAIDITDIEIALQNEKSEIEVVFRQGRTEHDELKKEIASLKSRVSNLPSAQITTRLALCKSLGIAESDMPFIGEVLQVRESERDWEGAAERLLHVFGLSLLVPDQHYAVVSDWVDKTQLKGRLIYYRVRTGARYRNNHDALDENSLAKKIEIKPDSIFYDWLEHEIYNRFDLSCCTNQDDFRRKARAITRAGQIKSGNERHEKDDRHRIDDRSRFILGWSNAAKIQALEDNEKKLGEELAMKGSKITKIVHELDALKKSAETLSKLEEYTDFNEIDWKSVSVEISKMQDEKRMLETTSDILKQLVERHNLLIEQIKAVEGTLNDLRDKASRADMKKIDAEELLLEIQNSINAAENATHASRFEELAIVQKEVLNDQSITVENCTNKEQEMRGWLQSKIDSENKRIQDLSSKVISAMQKYKIEYPIETQDVDVNLEAAHEFEAMLKTLQYHDLPKFEETFKQLLNENTIREVANFQSHLAREREDIRERISLINESLKQIDYVEGRYIKLEPHPTQDAEIRDFQADLRACTEGTFTGSDESQYSEEKFLQVKEIIERLRGREGTTEIDKRWTVKVTDVRNWFTFAASERWKEDDSEHEHYTDSGGKSGGQKEKLAYTILAASLAYQFGLEWGSTRSRTFRFVVIDEAFGRGSDESAKFGLTLFKKLNLQLLIVTPLQKIDIIEPFVSSVGFVHNDGGNASKLRNLSIEEYRARKADLAP